MGIRFIEVYFHDLTSVETMLEQLQQVTNISLIVEQKSVDYVRIKNVEKRADWFAVTWVKDRAAPGISGLPTAVSYYTDFKQSIYLESSEVSLRYVEVTLLFVLQRLGGFLPSLELPAWAGQTWQQYEKTSSGNSITGCLGNAFKQR